MAEHNRDYQSGVHASEIGTTCCEVKKKYAHAANNNTIKTAKKTYMVIEPTTYRCHYENSLSISPTNNEDTKINTSNRPSALNDSFTYSNIINPSRHNTIRDFTMSSYIS